MSHQVAQHGADGLVIVDNKHVVHGESLLPLN
jgi:hypothetical protein